MAKSYSCPKCRAILNPHHDITLIAQRGDEKFLVGFHPEPGNYEAYLPSNLKTEKGELWCFSCPVCGQDLSADEEGDLCELELQEGVEKLKVLFSRIAGEKATFVVGPDRKITQQFGPDAERKTHRLAFMKYNID